MLDPYSQINVSVNWLFHIRMYFNIYFLYLTYMIF